MSVMWRKLTTHGAVASMITGLVSAVVLIILSPTVWKDVFHIASAPPVSLKNPTIISMSLAFAVGIVVSLFTRDETAFNMFEEQQVRSYLGAEDGENQVVSH